LKRFLSLSAVFLLGSLGSAFATNVCPDFTPTGPAGADGFAASAGCGQLLTINSDLTVTFSTTGVGPFDGDEDTLVGIINNSSLTVLSLHLNSGTFVDPAGSITRGSFSLEGDGICTKITTAAESVYNNNSCSQDAIDTGTDPDDYSGMNVTFSNITGTFMTDADVLFVNGIAAGASTWFSVEGALTLTGSNVTQDNPSGAPEPGTIMLFASGIGLIALGRRKFSR
jgi:hypothetical protein